MARIARVVAPGFPHHLRYIICPGSGAMIRFFPLKNHFPKRKRLYGKVSRAFKAPEYLNEMENDRKNREK